MVLCDRKNVGAEDSMVGTEVAEDTKESGREELDLGWALRGVRPPFTWLFLNMDSMKDTGKNGTQFEMWSCCHALAKASSTIQMT